MLGALCSVNQPGGAVVVGGTRLRNDAIAPRSGLSTVSCQALRAWKPIQAGLSTRNSYSCYNREARAGAGSSQPLTSPSRSPRPIVSAASSPPAMADGLEEGMELVLTGDIGGTNSRLQMWGIRKGEMCTGDEDSADGVTVPGTELYECKYANEEFDSFNDVLRTFLEDIPGIQPGCAISVAVFAVAGPVENDRVEFTNRKSWTMDGRKLEAAGLGIGACKLVNDFVANGYGLLTLGKKDLSCLQDVPKVAGAPIALLGAGTGLGECYLTCSGGVYSCWASEGGHVEFSPRSKVELQLLSSLMDIFRANHRVSVERIVSGIGIANVYGFFRQQYPGLVNKLIDDEIMAAGDQRGGIVAGYYEKDTLCRWTMELVFATYGSEAGALALKLLPRGGLYIAGGLAPKNLHMFEETWVSEGVETSFMQRFSDKGRLSEALRQIPVNVVLNEGIGQAGAHLLAFRMLNGIPL